MASLARAEVEAVGVAKADQHYHLWLIISKDKLINNPKYVCDVEIWNGIIPYGRIMCVAYITKVKNKKGKDNR